MTRNLNKKDNGGKMKTIKLIMSTILALLVFGIGVYAEYVDLGSDPTKLEIAEIKDVKIESGYKYFAWSPDGNYFAVSNSKIIRTIIYKNDGTMFKEFNGVIRSWSKDSKKIYCIDAKIGKNHIYEILTGVQKDLDYFSYERCMSFYKDNNYLVYFTRKISNGLKYADIKIRNINTTAEKILFSTQASSNSELNFDMKYFSDENIFYTKDEFQNSGRPKRYLYKLDLIKGTEEKIKLNYSIHGFIQLDNSKIIFITSDVKGICYFLDENFQLVGKIAYDIDDVFLNKGKEFVPGETRVLIDRNIIPNGKMVILTKGTYDYHEMPIYEFLYIYDFKGNSKKLNVPKPVHLLGIAPNGYQVLVLVADSFKLVTLKKIDQ
jgi:hypothetical protein